MFRETFSRRFVSVRHALNGPAELPPFKNTSGLRDWKRFAAHSGSSLLHVRFVTAVRFVAAVRRKSASERENQR